MLHTCFIALVAAAVLDWVSMRSYDTLADYPHETVEIECAKCGRHCRLRTARLLEEHGPDIKLPDLLRQIAQCPKWGSMTDGCEACYALSSRIA